MKTKKNVSKQKKKNAKKSEIVKIRKYRTSMQIDNCDYNYLETILYMSFILFHSRGDSIGLIHSYGDSAGLLIREAKEMKCT